MLNAQIFAFADTIAALMLASGFLAAYLIDRNLKTFRWWAGFFALVALSFATIVSYPHPEPNWTEAVAWVLLYSAIALATYGMHREGENTSPPQTAIASTALLLALIVTVLMAQRAGHAQWATWGIVPSIILVLWSAAHIMQQKNLRSVDWGYVAALLVGVTVILARSWWFSRNPGLPPPPSFGYPPPLGASVPPELLRAPRPANPAASIIQPLMLSLFTILTMVGLAAALVFRTSLKVVGQMRERSATDAMTGLLNRAAFDERAAAALQTSGSLPIAAVVLDIDHFKRINDTGGHPAGDKVIACLGAILSEAVADRQIAGRIGGEEFAVLLPESTAGAARLFAEAIRTRFAAVRFGPETPWSVTISAGVAERLPGEPLHALIARADKALYEAKREGRNRVVLSALQDEPAEASAFVLAGQSA